MYKIIKYLRERLVAHFCAISFSDKYIFIRCLKHNFAALYK